LYKNDVVDQELNICAHNLISDIYNLNKIAKSGTEVAKLCFEKVYLNVEILLFKGSTPIYQAPQIPKKKTF